ncbi:MAG: uracil-DNA glycosylase [Pyrinomonadaceae bacterium]
MEDQSQIRATLLALAEDLAESASYMHELGIDGFDSDGFDGAGVTTTETQFAPQASAALPTPANTARLSSALRRNADAEQRPTTPTMKPYADAPLAGGVAASLQDQTEMAKRPTRKSTAPPADTPAHMDTLFGEITPMDEASLPRTNETLEDIRADIGECIRCPLSQSRNRVVNSEGNPNARLMFVGEAPGADEDAQGRPFVGRAGQLLNKIIEAIGLKREDVFIGNVNRCRPPQNRTPTPQEAATCKPFLLRDVAVVQPEVIVVMGNTAMKNLLDTKEGITKLRGQFQDYAGIKVMPTFHPAYLLRDPSKKRETWDDMKKVRDYLNETKK